MPFSEKTYCFFEDVNDFGYVIRVNENAPGLLRRDMSRGPVGVVGTGDCQAAERRYDISCRMLEVAWSRASPSWGWGGRRG